MDFYDNLNRMNFYVNDVYVFGIVHAQEFYYDSLKKLKKNINTFCKKSTEIIKKADICTYNFKTENDKEKRHIGLVVAGSYNCPEEVVSNDRKGIDVYSMTAVAWKAIQEITDMIENLQNRISILEGSE